VSIDVVRQFYAAADEGDMASILGLVAEDCEFDHRGPPGPPINQLYVGREGVADFFQTMAETQETLEFELKEYFGAGSRVVAVGFLRLRVIETGKEWESDLVITHTVEDGLIKSWRPIFDMGAEAEAYRP
jgi:ketosteroid isomerase-like protein